MSYLHKSKKSFEHFSPPFRILSQESYDNIIIMQVSNLCTDLEHFLYCFFYNAQNIVTDYILNLVFVRTNTMLANEKREDC